MMGEASEAVPEYLLMLFAPYFLQQVSAEAPSCETRAYFSVKHGHIYIDDLHAALLIVSSHIFSHLHHLFYIRRHSTNAASGLQAGGAYLIFGGTIAASAA